MTPDSGIWISLLERFGLPVTLVAALMFFLYQKVWPFLIQQMNYYQNKLDTSQAEFLKALERRDEEMAKYAASLERMAKSVDLFAIHVRESKERERQRR
jgi:hypothetical protein